MLIQKNPLTVLGTITRCWLFTYGTSIEDARRLLPRGLEPITHNGRAFWNVVYSSIHNMRPPGVPAPLGVDYWHVGYRLYVSCPLANGETVEGLWFARSDCDNLFMSIAGNLLTDFNFHTAGIRINESNGAVDLRIDSREAPMRARLIDERPAALPSGSAFASLDEAAAFLKYKPYDISIEPDGRANVVRIARDEDAWRSRLVRVEEQRWAFFDDKSVRPEICYQVDPIVYRWNRARVYETAR